MNYNLTKPCDECPYLRTSGFTFQSLKEHAVGEFACHKACDLTDDETVFVERKNGKTPHCAGALIFLEKQSKPHQMMRVAERLGQYDPTKLDMKANVGCKPSDYRAEAPSERKRRTAPQFVEKGTYKGYRIRAARKAGRCDKRGCGNIIETGHRYVEGDGHPTKGPLGMARERLCLSCGGVSEETETNMKKTSHPALSPSRQAKDDAIRTSDALAGYKVFRVRLAADDGWRFIAARNAREASKKVGGAAIERASPEQIELLALRALTEYGDLQ
jgi:hypothetical protein